MKEFFKTKGLLIAFALLFALCFGYIVFMLVLMVTGSKAEGVVISNTFDRKKSNVTVEYQVDGESYTFKHMYGRNAGLKVGKKVMVYYPDGKPEKGHIVKDMGVAPFVCIVSGLMVFVLIKKKK